MSTPCGPGRSRAPGPSFPATTARAGSPARRRPRDAAKAGPDSAGRRRSHKSAAHRCEKHRGGTAPASGRKPGRPVSPLTWKPSVSRARARRGTMLTSSTATPSRIMLNAPWLGCTPSRGALTFGSTDRMPPRRRTFYLADATVLSNAKVRGLSREHPRDWLAAWGAFHVLIGVATLNGSPRLSSRDLTDVLGPEHGDLVKMLQKVGLLTRSGIDPETFEEWCPKPRPKYPSDSGGGKPDSGGVDPDSGGVGADSAESNGAPTSTTSSASSSKTASSSPSRGAGKKHGLKALTGEDAIKALDAEYARGDIDGDEYRRRREGLGAA